MIFFVLIVVFVSGYIGVVWKLLFVVRDRLEEFGDRFGLIVIVILSMYVLIRIFSFE